ncbi:MAG: cytidylate kinase-like family protein [Prevotellaceae bacterium]|jgi:cytidylate kinase|nr:cytidylate kinase-like family protein [Prevotellaceae bacterium]
MIITIGRQLGSGGRDIGKKLSEAMNIAYYDRELIEITAKESGLNRKLFEEADERARTGFSAGILGMRVPFLSEGGIACGGLSNEMLFQIQSDVIRSLADKQPCVFIGRCADYILRDRKDCFSVFICANEEDRIRRIISYGDNSIPVEKARDLMERGDRRRAAFYNYYSNKTWGEASSYHVCINSSVFGVDGTVSLLKEMMGKVSFYSE